MAGRRIAAGSSEGSGLGIRPLGPVVLLVSLAVQVATFWPLRIDDAYIVFRFARHLGDGHGLVWNVGDSPVEGSTSLLWPLLLAPFASRAELVYGAAKLLGLAALLLAELLALRIALSVSGLRAAKSLAILLALSPALVFHALNGLETGLAALGVCTMLLVAAQATAAAGPERPPPPGGAIGYALVWLLGGLIRPELVLFGGLTALFALPLVMPGHRRPWLARVGFTFCLPGAALFLAHGWYFSRPLPTSYYAKRPVGLVSSVGAGYVLLSFLTLLGGAAVLVALGGLSPRADRRRRRLLLFLAGPALLLCASYAFIVPAMGFVHRFMIPFLPPLLVGAAVALGPALDERESGRTRIAVRALVLITAAQLLSAALPAVHFVRVNSRALRQCHESIGRILARLPERGRLLALSDVGAISYFSEWTSAEGAGLVTPRVLRESPSRSDLIRAVAPDVIMETCSDPGSPVPAGYRRLGAVPWLVFEGVERRLYQCVEARDGYRWAAELANEIAALPARPMKPPGYFRFYDWLKRTFGQKPTETAAHLDPPTGPGRSMPGPAR